jgi:hypothetical protein
MWHNFHVERLLEKQLVDVGSNEGAEVGHAQEKAKKLAHAQDNCK